MAKPRCRHERNCWLLGGVWVWCYRCGAVRGNFPGWSDGWVKPTGPDGVNPAMKEARNGK